MGLFSSIGDFLSGGLLGIGSSTDPSTSLMDLADPLNIAHTSASQRAANQQWQYEYDISKKNYEEAKAQNEWNRSFQEQQLQYQKDLNALQMEREDTATQRRVADLKASGLSPTLAAGSAADTGALHAGSISPVAPAQRGVAGDSKVQAAMFKESLLKDQIALASSLMGNFADISKTRAETQFINAQTNQLNAWTPIDLKLKEQLYEFNAEYNPYRIEEMISKIANTRGDTFYKERQSFLVDAQKVLADDEHGLNLYRQAGLVLDNSLKNARLSLENQTYIKEAIAIELLRQQYYQNEERFKDYFWDRNFYHNSWHVPIGFNLTPWNSFFGTKSVVGEDGSPVDPETILEKDGFDWHEKDFVGRVFRKATNFLKDTGIYKTLMRIMSMPAPPSNSSFNGVTRFN